MPRRKRHRRNRRGNKRQQNTNSVQNENTKAIHIQETPKKNDSDVFVSLPDTSPLVTPNTSLRKISNYNSLKSRSRSLVNTTPMNAKRNNNEINGTNLSKLFNVEDEEETSNNWLNNVTPKRSRNIRNRSPLTRPYINNLSGSISAAYIFEQRIMKNRTVRTNSSISKLHSPGLDKIPIMVDVATQTVFFDNQIEKRNSFNNESGDVYLQSCINIFETPKISQMEKIEKAFDFDSPMSHSFQSNSRKADDSNALQKSNRKDLNVDKTNLKYFQNLNDAFLPNTYISPKIIQREYKQSDSDADMSLFSPLLKKSSTPIEKLQKNDQIIENMAKNILNAQLARGNERFGSYFCNPPTPKTPNDKNINSKVEDKVRTLKINKLNSSINRRRIYSSVTPKTLKDISEKLYNNNSRHHSVTARAQSSKNDSNTIPKSFSSQKMSSGKSDNPRFLTNIKKLHNKYSGSLLSRIVDVCKSMGITIIKKLSSLCSNTRLENQKIDVDPQDKTVRDKICYNCTKYKEQVVTLTKSVGHLDKKLHEDKEIIINLQDALTIRDKICYNCKVYKEQIVALMKTVGLLDKELHEDKEKMVNLNDEVGNLNHEIGKIKGELAEFNVVKRKVEEMEEELKKLSQCPPTRSVVPSHTSPPPPPPLPPPPPPLPSTTMSLRGIQRNANKKVDKSNSENSRPVISLDDILNVKLKKTSDKPTVVRRASQPFISVEMLNKIKLRPTSRPHTPSSVNQVSSPSSLSSSPATSLTRILNNVDPNVRRLKRLRKYNSRYSLDDSRKHLLRRERNGEDT